MNGEAADAARVRLHASWKSRLGEAFASPSVQALGAFLRAEKAAGRTLYPPGAQMFAALDRTPFEAVKAVILGQDPYHGPGQAHGLSFSVPPGVPPPPSLQNIFTELERDPEVAFQRPGHGCLEVWAERGVLLLNAVLTVREKTPQSHQKKGWEPFTTAVLRHVASSPRKVVFLCFGKPALKLVESLGTSHPVVAAPHPSPLNGKAFVDTVAKEKLFTRVNSLLDAPLDWSL